MRGIPKIRLTATPTRANRGVDQWGDPLPYHNPPGTRPRGKVDGNRDWPKRRKYVLKGVRP